jgi:hypothetical protein
MHSRDFRTPGSTKYRYYIVTLTNIIISYTHYRVGLSRGIKYEFEQGPYGNLARKGSYKDPPARRGRDKYALLSLLA